MSEYIGHYEIISELGRGGMGVVYKAHEQSLNRYVAIKVLGEHLNDDPSYVQRFLREARSAAALNHPNIVQIYSVDEFEGKHYFAMEFVSGKSVLQMIRASGKIEPVEAARLCLQAASGLAAAHEKNIIHRDIKPANLMVDERGLLKITDFGLALLAGGASRLTATGMFMGTPGYLSPEQCRDEEIDVRTDIYSLGVTLFEMLTGSIPFKADSPLALLRQILEVEPPDVRDLNPDVPEGLRIILKKMMKKDRNLRYGTASELVSDLQAWLEKSGVSTAGMPIPIHTATPAAQLHEATAAMQPPLAAADATELMSAPSIPQPAPPQVSPPTPPSPPAQAPQPSQAAARVAGFVAPATAPAVPAPPSPAFAPAAAETIQGDTVSGSGMSIMPIIIVALLLLLGIGGVAAWKTGMLGKIRSRLGGAAAATTTAGLQEIPPETAEKDSSTTTAATVSGATAGETISIEEETPAESDPGNAKSSAAGSANPSPAKEPTTGGQSPGNAAAPQGGSSGAPSGKSAGIPASGKTASAPGAATASGSSPRSPAPPSSGPAETPAAAAPMPEESLPLGHGVALVGVGEPLLVGSVLDYLQATLVRRGIDVFDASGIPGVHEALTSGGDLNVVLRPYAHYLVLFSTENLGDRPLEYMGRWETEYQARLTVQAADLAYGTPLGPSIRKTLGYTRLNVEKKVPELLRADFRPMAKLYPNETPVLIDSRVGTRLESAIFTPGMGEAGIVAAGISIAVTVDSRQWPLSVDRALSAAYRDAPRFRSLPADPAPVNGGVVAKAQSASKSWSVMPVCH